MNLDELKAEARQDLPILDHEHMDQESYKNQVIKPKWLGYKTNFEQLLILRKSEHQKLFPTSELYSEECQTTDDISRMDML